MKKIKKNQSGRSMVEMLGVLAVIGVLSVGGIAGYKYAMDHMILNKTLEITSRLGLMIVDEAHKEPGESILDEFSTSDDDLSQEQTQFFCDMYLGQEYCAQSANRYIGMTSTLGRSRTLFSKDKKLYFGVFTDENRPGTNLYAHTVQLIFTGVSKSVCKSFISSIYSGNVLNIRKKGDGWNNKTAIWYFIGPDNTNAQTSLYSLEEIQSTICDDYRYAGQEKIGIGVLWDSYTK